MYMYTHTHTHIHSSLHSRFERGKGVTNTQTHHDPSTALIIVTNNRACV